MMTSIVQLTDTHIREPGRLAYGRLNTAPYLDAAVQSVLALPQPPTAIIITGDLTDFGRAAEYAFFKSMLAPLNAPIYLLPGNHDERSALRDAFPEHTYLGRDGFIQYAVDVGPIRLIALDTSEPGESSGRLCAERLAWLDTALAESAGKPVIIAMHHPPFRTLIGHMDKIGLVAGTEELAAIVARYPNVERIICGHIHRPIEVRFGGTIAMTGPSVAHQVVLDLDDNAASAWTLEPPAFRVHAWDAESHQVVTHSIHTNYPTLSVESNQGARFEGPYPFHDNGVLID